MVRFGDVGPIRDHGRTAFTDRTAFIGASGVVSVGASTDPIWRCAMILQRRKKVIERTVAEAAEAGLTQRDQGLLGQLLSTGAQLGKPRDVSYYLYLPDQATAREAAADASQAGFDTQVRPPLSEYPDQWPMVAIRLDCALTIEIIRANSNFFDSLARRHGGDYDGWQAPK